MCWLAYFKLKQTALCTGLPSPLCKQKRDKGSTSHISNCFQCITPVKSMTKCMATEYNVHKHNNMIQRSILMRKSREEMQGNKLVLKLFNSWLAHDLTEKSQTDTCVGVSLEAHVECTTHRTHCQGMGQETPASSVYTQLTYPGGLRWHLGETPLSGSLQPPQISK